MLNLDFLAGLSSPLLFLKATSKKQVWIPPFTRADGTYVAGHMAFVHVADNHDDAKVASGDGTHSQKAAHAKLSKEDWFHQLPTDHKAAVVLKHATELQDAASASAALSVFKKAVLAGQPPKAAGWKAFGALPAEKREAFIAEVKAAGKDAHFLAELEKHLGMAPSAAPGPAHAAEAAPTPAPAPEPAPTPVPAPVPAAAPAPADKPAPKVVAAAAGPAPLQVKAAISGAKLPSENTNAKSFNPKVDKILAALDAGDAHALLAMSFGTNTYGKKAAALANHALAALGSPHQVAHGQKAGEHSALAGGAAAPVPAPTAKSADQSHLVQGWINAIAANKTPTKEQAQAYEALEPEPQHDAKAAAHAGLLDTLDLDMDSDEDFDHGAEHLDKLHAAGLAGAPVAVPAAAPALPQPPADIADLSQSKKALKLAENGDVAGLQAYHAKLLGEKTKAYAAQLLSAIGAAPAPAAAPAAPASKLFVGLPASAIPNKPAGVATASWDKAVSFASTGNMPALQKMLAQLKAKALPVPKTTGAVSALIDQLVAHQEKLGGAADAGPKEGDTKVENGVTYVLQNGRWHKVKEPAAAAPAAASTATVVSHVYEHTTDGHDKFWAVAVEGSHLSVAWGKNGTAGQKKVKTFASSAAAQAEMDKLIKEKTGKGYVKQYSEPVASFAPVAAAKPAPKVVSAAPVGGATIATPAPAGAPAASPAGDAPVAIDSWKQVGPQGGYNPGGTFVDEHGQHWYCKFPAGGEKVAKNELLASKLYALAGVDVPTVQLVTQGGKVGLASKIIDGAVKNKAALLEGKAPGILSGFAVDAWLANWDAVGNNPAAGKGFDNILIGPGGKAYRIDAGGALMYGGAGGKKQKFGTEVIELKTMLDPKKNANTAAVFGKMTPADVTASVASVVAISDEEIKALVLQHGPGTLADRLELTATLIARKHNMLAQYPNAAGKPGVKPKAAKKPIVFDPTKLGAAPDFMNWKGPGQHGPASMKEKNEANQAGVNELLKVAQAGNIQAIKDHKLPFYAPDGSVSHMVTPLTHPSQYVKGYAQQLINEIDAQLNPPKPFRWDGASTLAELHSAYPKVQNILAAGVEKLGYYVKLGKPGIIKAEDLALPAKATWANGKLNRKTYAAAAQAVTAKLPQQQKDALKSYTGSGYTEINHSLWKGNPVGAAKSAEEALMTLGHDIAPGTILSRKIGMHGADLEALQKSVGSVLQEPAVMSTSLRPSCWSGNVHFKITVGPGVKGLYVGPGSTGEKSALSKHASEDEMLLPPNTRLLVQAVKPGMKGDDPDGFGTGSAWIVEVLVLPTH